MSIKLEKLTHIYNPGAHFAFKALDEVDLELSKGKITAIIGHTGSGKTTLVQHLNALLIPTSGTLYVDDFVITNDKKKNKNLKNLRKKVGLVFQFPEYQLFEETIKDDIAFGPRNFNVPEEEIEKLTKELICKVGLDESYLERSPLELSGGQKRRVAIAGILAMSPDILVLDEPTAGLDPAGTYEMLDLFLKLNKEGTTIIIVTHEMEYVLEYCDLCVVVNKSKIAYEGAPKDLFASKEIMEKVGIEPPLAYDFAMKLKENGLDVDLANIKNTQTLANEIVRVLKGGEVNE